MNFYFNGGYSYKIVICWMLIYVRMELLFLGQTSNSRQLGPSTCMESHNESFIKDNTNLFSMLKIRASIGNPGNQNFGSFNTITTYKFNNWMMNNFGTGLLVDAFGDPDLEWQKTIDKNIGCDISMF